MRTTILLLAIAAAAAIATPARAVDLTCTIPSAAVPRLMELCEELRLELPARAADWSPSICVSKLLRAITLETERDTVRAQTRRTVAHTVNVAVSDLAAKWPDEIPRARCGDGILDTIGPHHIEECDDGNRQPNDGCDSQCRIETPGGGGGPP